MSFGGGGSGQIKETPAEKTQSQLAIQQWNNYQTKFAPLESRLAGAVEATPGQHAQTQGQVQSATEQQFAPVRKQQAHGLFTHGFSPDSGGFQADMHQLNTNQAQSGGLNAAHADQAISNNQAYGELGVTQLGRGDTGTALQMATNAASNAQSQAESDARIALQKSMANQQLVGTVLGAGAGAAYQRFSSPSSPSVSGGGLKGVPSTGSSYSGGMTGVDASQWQPTSYALPDSGTAGLNTYGA